MNYIEFDRNAGLIRCFRNTHETCAIGSQFINVNTDDELISFIKERGGVNATISFILKKYQHS